MAALTISQVRDVKAGDVRILYFQATSTATDDTIDLSSYFQQLFVVQAIDDTNNAATTCTFSTATVTTTGTVGLTHFIAWGRGSSA